MHHHSANPLLLFCSVSFIFVFLLSLAPATAARAQALFSEERDALLRLRESLQSPVMSLHSLWTGPPCNGNTGRWKGIACWEGHVVGIVLHSTQLSGEFPEDCLSNLAFLEKVLLSNNSISGPLPQLSGLHRLRQISFRANQFSGGIPFHYVQLEKLEVLELQENSLTGEIPEFLQPNLVVFNVSHNRLTGVIPASNVLQRFSEDSFGNNPGLCGLPLKNSTCNHPTSHLPTPPTDNTTPAVSQRPLPDGKSRVKNVAISMIFLIVLLASFGALLQLGLKRRKYRSQEEENERSIAEMGQLQRSFALPKTIVMKGSEELSGRNTMPNLIFFDDSKAVFGLRELLGSAAEIIGEGMTGTSYKAVVQRGAAVVVRRLHLDAIKLRKEEFVRHMVRIGGVRHENMAEMVAFSYSERQVLLVYDYVPGGCLFDRLHAGRGPGTLPLRWKTRLQVVKGVATGLTYMHQVLRVPHANLKSTNIILSTANAHPKLTHYGLEPILTRRVSMESLAASRAPEFFQAKKFTFKSDVWCFGIVLLELVSGRKELPALLPSANLARSSSSRPDHQRAWSALNQGWSFDVLDKQMVLDEQQRANVLSLVEVGLKCTAPVPEHRPDMARVLKMIEEIEEREKEEIRANRRRQHDDSHGKLFLVHHG